MSKERSEDVLDQLAAWLEAEELAAYKLSGLRGLSEWHSGRWIGLEDVLIELKRLRAAQEPE